MKLTKLNGNIHKNWTKDEYEKAYEFLTCSTCNKTKKLEEFDLIKSPASKSWYRRGECKLCRMNKNNVYKSNIYYSGSTWIWRFQSMKKVAKEEKVSVFFTKQSLEQFIKANPYCYISGKYIPDYFTKMPAAYFCDRIGLKLYGGTGKAGGDYRPENVRPCLFHFNQLREITGLSSGQMALIFAIPRQVEKFKRVKNKVWAYLKGFFS